MNKITIPIKGMHCRSCELLIEEKLKEVQGVKSVTVNYKKSQAFIYTKTKVDMKTVQNAVSEAGYEVGIDDTGAWVSLNPGEYLDLALAGLLLFVLYLITKKLGLSTLSVGGGNPSSLLVILLIGLTAGISTCMALVGGLILGISARHAEKHPEATSMQRFRPHLFFNLGRISSYFILGGLIGMIGRAFQLSGTFLGLLIILVGLVMIVLGLQLTAMFPRLSSGSFTLPSSISKFLGIKKHHDKEYSHRNSVLVGALTFFLPCGFTQAMQLYAMSTGSFISGALIMGTFALGTAPGLLGVGGLTSVLKGAAAKKFYKFTGLLVIVLALVNIGNGYNLTGWKFGSSSAATTASAVNDPNVKIVDGIQVVLMDQVAGGYKPNKFTIQKNIPVKWVINAKNTDACSASILSTKLGIRKVLEKGENIIEFTPTESGEVKFSCLMGMYTGKFIIVDTGQSLSKKAEKTEQKNTTTTPPQAQATPPQPTPNEKPVQNQGVTGTQILRATFKKVDWNADSDISPNKFTVESGKPVRFEMEAEADGEGCMSTIMIPGLVDKPELIVKGQKVVFEFTPTKKGSYNITCAMGVSRGTITVN